MLVLAVLVLLVYSPSTANEFVWDDHFFIETNASVQGRAPVSSFWLKPVKYERAVLPLWRPLPLTIYAALRAMFGNSPLAFHLAGVLIHAGVALLFFRWLAGMGSSRPVAFAAASLYAVHPYLTSAVAYVAGMADPLAAFFSLTALLFWRDAFLRFETAPHSSRWQKRLLAGSLAWLCALFCKEWTLIVPLLAAAAFAGDGRKKSPENLKVWKAGLWSCLLIAGVYVCWRSEVFAKAELVATVRMDFLERIACAVMSFGFYQLGGLLPLNLRMDRYYALANPEFWWWFAAGVALMVYWFLALRSFAGAWYRSGAWRGFAWFWILWLFHSNLPFVLNAHIAEHWMYFAFMGLAWAGADLWTAFGQSLRPGTRGALLASLAALGLFWSGRSFVRQLDWENDFVFFHRNIEAGADTSRSHLSLGSAYAKEGEFEKAAEHFSKALEKDPANFQAAMALARCHFFMGDYARAAAIVKQLRVRYPTDPVLEWFERDCLKRVESKKSRSP
jgi:hypothetical protein